MQYESHLNALDQRRQKVYHYLFLQELLAKKKLRLATANGDQNKSMF